MSFTTAASTFVASISPCESKGPSLHSPEMASRLDKAHRASGLAHSRRDFLLRAFKPALSNPDSSEKCGSNTPPENGEGVSALIDMASVSSDPLPLHARRELARKRLRQHKLKKSFDSAVGAVDWLAADLAKLMTFAKTLPLFLNDKKNEESGEEEGEGANNAISYFLDQEAADAEVSTPHPRCEWPRTTLKVESEAFFVEIPPVMEETPSGPRCNWPRAAINTSVRSDTSVPDLLPSNSLSYPRCAWPRTSSNGLSVVHSTEQEEERKEDSSKYDVLISHPQEAHPRCAWPRHSQPLPLTPTSSFSNSPASLTGTEAELARRSVLNASQAIQALFPRCDWPKKSSSLTASSSSQVLFVQEDSTATTDAKPDETEPLLISPRCSWPRASLSTPPNVQDSASVVGLIPLGPRCSWPRIATLGGRASSTIASNPNGYATLAPTPPLPSELPESNPRFSEVELGPRCNWPRKAPESPQSEVPVSTLSQTLTQLQEVPLGPRCNWPRNVSDVSRPITPPTSVPSDIQLVDGPRCTWPRSTSPAPAPLDLSSPPLSESRLNAGPRCSWPKNDSSVPKSLAPFALESPLVAGPRCGWPRSISPIPDPLDLPALSPSEPQFVAGPRCSWPRSSEPLKAFPTKSTVAAEPPTPHGPRCVWPRGNSSTETPLKVSLPSDPAKPESPFAAKGPFSTPRAKQGADAEKDARDSDDVTWPRRVMATTVGLSLMNHFFTSQGGQAFALPLDSLNFASSQKEAGLAH